MIRAAHQIQQLAAYLGSEVASKVTRLGVVLLMARTLDARDVGIVATALALSEVLKALTENGVGHFVVLSPKSELDQRCLTANRIFWASCISLAAMQIAGAAAIAVYGGNLTVSIMVGLLGLEYLFMPSGLVSCALAVRQGALARVAAIGGAQNVGSNIVTCCLLLVWPDALAIVIGKLATAPVWLVGMRRLAPWTPDHSVRPTPIREFLEFCLPVLGVEFISALRLQADKLIIGAILGAESLGIYYFAVNAGLGIGSSITSGLSAIALSSFAANSNRDQALRQNLVLSVGLVTPLIIIQALAAPYYVPMVFGPKWTSIAPMVAVLCLAAIPGAVWATSARWLRSEGRTDREFFGSTVIAVTTTVAVAIAASTGGLSALGPAFLASATLGYLAAAAPALRRALMDCPAPRPLATRIA